MNEENLTNTAGALEALLSAVEDPSPGWHKDDPGSLLSHQLNAPLLLDLPTLPGVNCEDISEATSTGLELESFGQLLAIDEPPRFLLATAKDYFKVSASKQDGPIPQQVASVLYYAVIAAAKRAGQPSLTKMPEERQREGFTWAKNRAWLSQDLIDLFDAVLS